MEFMLHNIAGHSFSYRTNYISLRFLFICHFEFVTQLSAFFAICLNFFAFALSNDSSDATLFLREKYSNETFIVWIRNKSRSTRFAIYINQNCTQKYLITHFLRKID